MLTIIIFTENEGKSLDKILNDLNKIDNKIFINIWVVNWGKTKYYKKNKIKITKNKKVKLHKCKLKNFGERYIKYLSKVKTKYVWNIGDDDRINYKNFSILENVITKNYSGMTMSNSTFTNKVNFKKNNNYKIKNFEIEKYIHLTGFITSQIINVEILKEKLILNKNFKITMYPHLYFIFYLIFKRGNWKWLQLDLVKIRINNFRYINKKYSLNRLNNEYQGYLIPLRKFISKNSNTYRLCYEKLFFKNIISWINLNIKINGKKKTYEIISSNDYLKIFSKKIAIVNFLIFILPNKLLNLIKRFTK